MTAKDAARRAEGADHPADLSLTAETSPPDTLIVSDDLPFLASVVKALAGAGLETVVSSIPDEALSLIDSKAPKVVVLDLAIPTLDETSFLRVLRQKHSPGMLPVIAAAPDAQSEDLIGCLDAGANDIVNKPLDIASFVRRVRLQLGISSAFRTLEESEKRLSKLVSQGSEAAWGIRPFADRIEATREFRHIFGNPTGGLTLHAWLDALFEGDRPALESSIESVCSGIVESFECRVRYRRDEDELGWALVRGQAERDANGEVARVSGDVIDITGERGIDHVAAVGSATACRKRLRKLIEAGARAPFALIDIDEFNAILGSDGVFSSDEALLVYGQSLRRLIGGLGEVYRLGADTFAVVGAEGVSEAQLAEVLRQIASGSDIGVRVADRWVHRVTSSIGRVGARHVATAPRQTILRARLALKCAKAAGRGSVREYTEELELEAMRRPIMAERLERALDRDLIDVAYQPIVDLDTGEWIAVEALARWRDEELGFVEPSEFVACADWMGQSIELTRLVANHAFASLPKAPSDAAPLLSLNIAGASASDPKLAPVIERCARAHGVALERLVLEVAEDDLAGDFDAATQALGDLLKKGVRLAIDDFGTGYSSLTNLCRLPAAWLKLDQALLHAAEEDPDARQLVASISRTARRLKMAVVAEGVENAPQVEVAREVGAVYAQGFHFSPALSASAFCKSWIQRVGGEGQARASA